MDTVTRGHVVAGISSTLHHLILVIVLFAVASPFAIADQHQVELTTHLRHGKRIAEPDLWKIKVGDHATITWITEQTVELHLHGYDITVFAAPNQRNAMRFEASIAGRFPVEIHEENGHTVVFYLEVHPN